MTDREAMTLEERVARAICLSREACESCWRECRAPYDALRKSAQWTKALAAIAAMRDDKSGQTDNETENT